MKKRSEQVRFCGSSSVKNSLATIVDEKTMKEIHYDLSNPSSGTASLNRLLKEIEKRGQYS